MDYKVPDNLFYTNTHEWVKKENDIAIIGITDFAQSELGDIVGLELPELDDDIEKDDQIALVEAVKAAEEMNSPLSGIIVEVNEELVDELELMHKSPFDKGWICKIKYSNSEEFDELLSSEEYKDLIK